MCFRHSHCKNSTTLALGDYNGYFQVIKRNLDNKTIVINNISVNISTLWLAIILSHIRATDILSFYFGQFRTFRQIKSPGAILDLSIILNNFRLVGNFVFSDNFGLLTTLAFRVISANCKHSSDCRCLSNFGLSRNIGFRRCEAEAYNSIIFYFFSDTMNTAFTSNTFVFDCLRINEKIFVSIFLIKIILK